MKKGIPILAFLIDDDVAVKPGFMDTKNYDKLIEAAADQKVAEAAKKNEAEAVLKKLLASGVSADEILAKLK